MPKGEERETAPEPVASITKEIEEQLVALELSLTGASAWHSVLMLNVPAFHAFVAIWEG